MANEKQNNTGEIVIYQSEEGKAQIDVIFSDEMVWLSIEQMSILFGKSRSTINEHILHIYEEGELVETNTMRKIGNSDFSAKPTNFYNLDVVISVGYRVHSVQGTRFRQWATQRIREYTVYRQREMNQLESDYDRAVRQLSLFSGANDQLKGEN